MQVCASGTGYVGLVTGVCLAQIGHLGVTRGEILFIAVGTPALPSGASDTRYVEAVARGIGHHLDGGYKVIVNKSTVPIGSGDWAAECHSETTSFDVVSNPEFLREGSAIHDTFNPDRIVIGKSFRC